MNIGYVKNKKVKQQANILIYLDVAIQIKKFKITEQVKSLDHVYAREKEKLHIKTFNTYHKGINKQE